jgi:hypothetical protein
MTTHAYPLLQTTTVGTPNDETLNIHEMYWDHEIDRVAHRLQNGADPNIEYADVLTDDGVHYTDLTATSAAVIADAEAGELLFTPLLLNHGGNLHQVDSLGRTLLSFAFTKPVFDYLKAHGAPLPELNGDAAHDAMVIPQLKSSVEPVPIDEWRTLVTREMVDNLDNLGYFATNPSDGAAGSLAPPPLIARFNPARIIDDALWEDDKGRIRRLIELGGVDGRMTYTFHIDRREHAYTFESLSAVGLAMLSDCKRGLVDDDTHDIPDREGEVRNLLLFDGVAPFEGPQDQDGNTLLHLVCAPKVAGWLMDRGLSLDAINNDGQTPLEYQAMPEDVRAFIEQKVLTDGLAQAASDAREGEGRGRRRL